MIRVRVQRLNQMIQSIEITGHAQSAKTGEDLVCAAISSIATGALNALDQLYSNDVVLTYQEAPEALIKIQVIKNDATLEQLLQFLLIQIRTVENSHKKYIQIQEV